MAVRPRIHIWCTRTTKLFVAKLKNEFTQKNKEIESLSTYHHADLKASEDFHNSGASQQNSVAAYS